MILWRSFLPTGTSPTTSTSPSYDTSSSPSPSPSPLPSPLSPSLSRPSHLSVFIQTEGTGGDHQKDNFPNDVILNHPSPLPALYIFIGLLLYRLKKKKKKKKKGKLLSFRSISRNLMEGCLHPAPILSFLFFSLFLFTNSAQRMYVGRVKGMADH